MKKEKRNKGTKLDKGERLVLCATNAILEILKKEGFKEAATVGKRLSVLVELPGGGLHLADIFAVLSDAICMKELACLEQHLTALVEILDDAIDNAQELANTPLLEEPHSSLALSNLHSYSHVGAGYER